jgi:hypothetical protein
MPSPDQLYRKSAISNTAMILENPTFARGFSACSLTQKSERSGGWRSERDSNPAYGRVLPGAPITFAAAAQSNAEIVSAITRDDCRLPIEVFC